MLIAILLEAKSIEDSLPTYRLNESRVSAQFYNFKHQFDMNSIIYMKLYRSMPLFLGDARFVLATVGGILPAPSGLIVRGGQPWENTIYLNGILLPDPSFKVYIQFPVDIDAISTVELHRGDIPIEEQGLSSTIYIRTQADRKFLKMGFPLMSGMWSGGDYSIYGDFLYPLAFGQDRFISTSALIEKGKIDGYIMNNILTYRFMDFMDTLQWQRVDTRYSIGGISFKPSPSWNIYYSMRYTIVRSDTTTEFWSHLGGVRFSIRGKGCDVFAFTKRSSLTMGKGTRGKTYRAGCFYTFGKLGIRLDVFDGKLKPTARFKYKKFISKNLAVKFYLGNAYQNIAYLAFPISEPFIAPEPSMVFTFLNGFELVGKVSLDANFYMKNYDPYTFDVLSGMSDTGSVLSRRQGVTGMDFTITSSRFVLSGFLQKSFWWSDVRWGLNAVLFDRNNNGAISLFMHQGFPVLIYTDEEHNTRVKREDDVFVFSIQYSLLREKWLITVGIYNFLQRGEHGPSALYADFVIPIISVRREF